MGRGLSKNTIGGQKDRRSNKIQRNTSESGIKCVCLNARIIINKKTELNIMVDDIKPHIIGITESWANNDTVADSGGGAQGARTPPPSGKKKTKKGPH